MSEENKMNNYKNFCCYLLLIFPATLVLSNLLSELIIILLVIFFLKNNFNNIKNIFNFHKTCILIFAFYFLLIISSIFSDYLIFSLKKSFFFIRFILFSFAVYWTLTLKKDLLFTLLKVMIFIFLILFIGGFIEYYFDYNILYGFKEIYDDKYFETRKVSSFFGKEFILGSYISRLLPLLIGIFFIYKNIINYKYKFFYFLVFVLSTITIFFSGERLSFFFLLILLSSLLFIITFNKKNFYILLVIFSVMTLTLYSFDNQRNRIFNYTLKQMTQERKLIFFTKEHNSHFITAYRIFLDNKILGSGPNTFRKICSDKKYEFNLNSCSTHPHNFFIQLLSETGLVGAFIPISLFFFIVFIFFYKNLRKNDFIKTKEFPLNFFLVFFIIALFPISPNGNFFNNKLNMIFFLGYGIYLYYLKNLRKLNTI